MSVDRETLAAYDARAQDYADKFEATKPGATLKRFMGAVKAGGKVLDIGCGPGGSAVMMTDAGFRVTCMDASAEMVRAAQARGLDAHLQTFEQIDGSEVYDGIWANFSLLHAPRTQLPGHLTAASRALKRIGVFHIGMKIGTGEVRDKLGRLYTFVTAKELRGLLRDAGITPDFEHEFSEKGLAGTVDPAIVIQGRKSDA